MKKDEGHDGGKDGLKTGKPVGGLERASKRFSFPWIMVS